MLTVVLTALFGGVFASSVLGPLMDDDPEDMHEKKRTATEGNPSDRQAGSAGERSSRLVEEPKDHNGEGALPVDSGGRASSEPLEVVSGSTGMFLGTEADDRITVEADTGRDASYIWDGYADQTVLLEIAGGEGDDTINLSGAGYVVRGDEGADEIRLGDASGIAVFAGKDDLVIGGGGANIYVNISADARFVGGEADELVHSTSTAVVNLGAGNDRFFGINVAGTQTTVGQEVLGGEGDDFLHGGIDEQALWWAHANDQGNISLDVDTLNGGAGSDTLLGSHGDILIGGEGDDEFTLVLNRLETDEYAKILDFAAGQDVLTIRYGENSGGTPNADLFENLQQGYFNVTEENGDTFISNDTGQVLVQLVGTTGLTIGIQSWLPEQARFQLLGLDGSPVQKEACSVLIVEQWQ